MGISLFGCVEGVRGAGAGWIGSGSGEIGFLGSAGDGTGLGVTVGVGLGIGGTGAGAVGMTGAGTALWRRVAICRTALVVSFPQVRKGNWVDGLFMIPNISPTDCQR